MESATRRRQQATAPGTSSSAGGVGSPAGHQRTASGGTASSSALVGSAASGQQRMGAAAPLTMRKPPLLDGPQAAARTHATQLEKANALAPLLRRPPPPLVENRDPVLLEKHAREQENRQLSVVERQTEIRVNVSREDFPSRSVWITLRFVPSASQAAWGPFIDDIKNMLGVDFIDCILERSTMRYVHRTASLRHNAQYVVRQREEASVIEVLNNSTVPDNIVWPITKHMMAAKESLVDLDSFQAPMEERVDNLINRPMGRMQQVRAAEAILKAPDSAGIIEAVKSIMHLKPRTKFQTLLDTDEPEVRTFRNVIEASENMFLGCMKPLDPEVDHISIYRLAIQSINRLFNAAGRLKLLFPDDEMMDFVCETMECFRDEIDIIVPCLQLLSDMLPMITADVWKRRVLYTIMDTLQFYAPPCPEGKVRIITRTQPTPMEREGMMMSDEDSWSKYYNKAWMQEWMDKHFPKKKKGIRGSVMAGGGGQGNAKSAIEALAYTGMSRREMRKSSMMAKNAMLTSLASQSMKMKSAFAGVYQVRDFDAFQIQNGTIGGVPLPPKTWVGPFRPRRVASSKGFQRVIYVEEKPKAPELQLKPLPTVDGVKFRAWATTGNREKAMLQCFATLLRFVGVHHTNRLLAFRMTTNNEVCDIGLVCQGLPRILDYVIWITDTLHLDFMDRYADELMSLSSVRGGDSLLRMSTVLSDGASAARGRPGSSSDYDLEGMEFDEMSVVTMQSLERVHVIDWAKLVETNEGVGEEKLRSKDQLRKERAARETKALAEALGKKEEDIIAEDEEDGVKNYADIKTDRARASDELEYRQAKIVKELQKQRDDYTPAIPDFFMPTESVVICTSIISVHSDVLPQEQEMANKWLGIWNDGSKHFQKLVTKGTNMSA